MLCREMLPAPRAGVSASAADVHVSPGHRPSRCRVAVGPLPFPSAPMGAHQRHGHLPGGVVGPLTPVPHLSRFPCRQNELSSFLGADVPAWLRFARLEARWLAGARCGRGGAGRRRGERWLRGAPARISLLFLHLQLSGNRQQGPASRLSPAAGTGCCELLKMCQRAGFNTCGSGVAKQVRAEPGD